MEYCISYREVIYKVKFYEFYGVQKASFLEAFIRRRNIMIDELFDPEMFAILDDNPLIYLIHRYLPKRISLKKFYTCGTCLEEISISKLVLYDCQHFLCMRCISDCKKMGFLRCPFCKIDIDDIHCISGSVLSFGEI